MSFLEQKDSYGTQHIEKNESQTHSPESSSFVAGHHRESAGKNADNDDYARREADCRTGNDYHQARLCPGRVRHCSQNCGQGRYEKTERQRMKTNIPIRIGICGCMKLYRGDLNGRQLRISGKWFVLEEVILPNEEFHTKSIKKQRCHFFIDKDKGGINDGTIFLVRYELYLSPSGRSERLSDLGFYGGYSRDGKAFSPQRMIRYMRELIAEMSQRNRAQWLRRMAFAK
jgi:hypothetical protein